MLTFKLSRRGKTKKPTYRLVVVDKKKNPWGMVKEDVGFYNPHIKKTQLKIERIKYWLSKGAQPSTTVHNLLVKEKILEAPKKKIKIKKSSSAKTSGDEEKSTPANKALGNKENSITETATEAPITTEILKTEETKPETPQTKTTTSTS